MFAVWYIGYDITTCTFPVAVNNHAYICTQLWYPGLNSGSTLGAFATKDITSTICSIRAGVHPGGSTHTTTNIIIGY